MSTIIQDIEKAQQSIEDEAVLDVMQQSIQEEYAKDIEKGTGGVAEEEWPGDSDSDDGEEEAEGAPEDPDGNSFAI